MKKLFYRLSSSRSFVRLLLILAFVALASLFAQQAVAQDLLGWDPAPPDAADGSWDAHLTCGSVQGITTLTHNPPSGDSAGENGTVDCTFTDNTRLCGPVPGITNCVCPDGSATCTQGIFGETATCLLNITFKNLSESCANNADGTSTLTITGMCPYQKGNRTFGAIGSGGTIDCRPRDTSGNLTGGSNPTFCGYAGTDPSGNPTTNPQDCRWNVGFGALKNSKLVNLTQTQCNTIFGTSPVFSVSQNYRQSGCIGPFAGLGGINQDFCHSDTWDGSVPATCDVTTATGPKNSGTGQVDSHLTADTEYSPTTVNPTCGNPTNSGKITLTVLANGGDPGTNPVAVEKINTDTIWVNKPEFTTIPGTCSLAYDLLLNPTSLTCQVYKCVNSDNILTGFIASDFQTATLTMDACIGGPRGVDGKCPDTDTHVVGDAVTVGVSTNAP